MGTGSQLVLRAGGEGTQDWSSCEYLEAIRQQGAGERDTGDGGVGEGCRGLWRIGGFGVGGGLE